MMTEATIRERLDVLMEQEVIIHALRMALSPETYDRWQLIIGNLREEGARLLLEVRRGNR